MCNKTEVTVHFTRLFCQSMFEGPDVVTREHPKDHQPLALAPYPRITNLPLQPGEKRQK
jgi:hypothetical protein